MKRRLVALALFFAPWQALAAANAVNMQGFLRSRTSESIRPPQSEEWSFTIQMLAPEGERVEKGAVVAKLEGQRLKQRMTEEQNRVLERKVKREGKLNEIKSAIDALVKQIADEESELLLLTNTQGMTPQESSSEWVVSGRDRLIEKLDVELRRLKLKISREKLARKQRLLTATQVANTSGDQAAEARVTKIKDAMAASEQRATRGGVVIYKRTPWERTKVRVGGTAYRGTEVLAIVDDQDLFVEAFLKEEDWAKIRVGLEAEVKILGRRETKVSATISKISAIVMKASDWDRALPSSHPLFETRVFKVELALKASASDAKPEGEVEVQLSGGLER